MSWESYDDKCEGCQPTGIDVVTGQRMPRRAVRAMRRAFNKLPLSDKQAWHEATCCNSREPQILAVMERITREMQKALDAVK